MTFPPKDIKKGPLPLQKGMNIKGSEMLEQPTEGEEQRGRGPMRHLPLPRELPESTGTNEPTSAPLIKSRGEVSCAHPPATESDPFRTGVLKPDCGDNPFGVKRGG